jgi:phosphoglycerate dehydrogenase-like enzyme
MTITILVLPPPALWAEIVTPGAEARLAGLGEVDRNTSDGNLTREAVLERIAGADAVLTSWGAPVFDAELLARAPRLRIIAHAAGTIKSFVKPEVFERQIAVTHAAGVIAESVGEWTLTATLAALRRVVDFDHIMRPDPAAGADGAPAGGRPRGWGPEKGRVGYGEELYGKRVGVVAASLTGRAFIRLLSVFGCDVCVFDPYLPAEGAAALGVRKVEDLGELMATCDVVSNHAPTTPETDGMISAAMLARLRDGALFVNTARAGAIDYQALTEELRAGRIRAALDVFPKEPLDPASPLRSLPNVVLSPHVAGATVESRRRLGTAMIDEIARHFAGQPLRYGVSAARLATMA